MPESYHPSETQLTPSEQRESIKTEQGILNQEAAFLKRIGSGRSIGLLTNAYTDVVIPHYQLVNEGMGHIYTHLEKVVNTTNFDRLFGAALYHDWLEGRYRTDEQIEQMREDCLSGQFSLHIAYAEAYRLGRTTELERKSQTVEKNVRFSTIRNPNDVVSNKALVTAVYQRMLDQAEMTYGEVDLQTAFVTEAILNAPFLETAVRKQAISTDKQIRHKKYIEDVLSFAEQFDPQGRFKQFLDLTDAFSADWTDEITPKPLGRFDQEYIEKAYSVAKALREGTTDIVDVYTLQSETMMRRGHLFTAHLERSDMGDYYLKVAQRPQNSRSFENIVGYEEQKNVFKRLLEVLETNDPILRDIGLVIVAGRPGHGKSLTVEAFLNELPESARGLVMRSSGNTFREMSLLKKLAAHHPELELVPVIEDVDAIAADRLNSEGTKVFLELDSVHQSVDDLRNLHLIATTNRPDIIDKAVMRPGRTPILVLYESPDKTVRQKLASLYSNEYQISCSEELLRSFSEDTKGLSPDEIRSIFWNFKFRNETKPTPEQIKKEIGLIKLRQNAKDYTTTDSSSTILYEENEDEEN